MVGIETIESIGHSFKYFSCKGIRERVVTEVWSTRFFQDGFIAVF